MAANTSCLQSMLAYVLYNNMRVWRHMFGGQTCYHNYGRVPFTRLWLHTKSNYIILHIVYIDGMAKGLNSTKNLLIKYITSIDNVWMFMIPLLSTLRMWHDLREWMKTDPSITYYSCLFPHSRASKIMLYRSTS